MSYDIFISYRRNGGEHTAKIIKDSLTEQGYSVFFDVESLRSGNFNTKLYSVIDECRDFIVILSPDALERCNDPSDWVRREVEYAIEKGKNVIPILMRGFKFDTELPESLAKLPTYNGIEATTEFFDAFIEKLKTFLTSKPPFFKRFGKKGLKRVGLLLLAAVLLTAGAFIKERLAANGDAADVYPSDNAEVNLTDEVLYCAGMNLTNLDIITGAVYKAVDAAERAVQTDSYNNFDNEINLCIQTVDKVDETVGEPSVQFIERLSDSPFSTADITAMHTQVALDKNEALDDLYFIKNLLSPDFITTKEKKLETVQAYRKMYVEYAKAYAYNTNHLLVPITDGAALKGFQRDVLSHLVNIPLSVSNWQYDKEALEIATEECFNTIESIQLQLASSMGNEQAKIDQIYASLDSIHEMCTPTAEDDINTLWFKMNHLFSIGVYDVRYADTAIKCIDLYKALATDPEAEEYLPMLYAIADKIKSGYTVKGVLVMGYDPASPHPEFKVGDVIVSLNSEECYTMEKYTELKGALTDDRYVAEVLRLSENGELELVTLDLDRSMPGTYIATVTYHDDSVQ